MNEATTLGTAAESVPESQAGFRESLRRAFRAQCLGMWRPRSTMHDSDNISLRAAWLSHFVVTVLGLLPMLLAFHSVICLMLWLQGVVQTPGYFELLGAHLGEMFRAFDDLFFWLVMAAICACLEVGELLLALVSVSWSASNEAVQRTVRHSLRTTWLVTPVFLCSFVPWSLYTYTEVFRFGPADSWHRINTTLCWSAIAVSAWAVWVLLRACAARRQRFVPATNWCQNCGYDLSGTDPESRCPECGEPAAASLGTGLRGPTTWDMRAGGMITSYWRTLHDIVWHPIRFCRHMHAHSGQSAARGFLVISALVTALFSAFSFVLLLAMENMLSFDNVLDLSYIFVMHAGSLLGLILLISGAVGMAVSWCCGRTMLAPVAKVFFYLSGLYVVLVPGWYCSAAALASTLPNWRGMQMGTLTAVALIPLMLMYLVAVHARAIRQVLYANT